MKFVFGLLAFIITTIVLIVLIVSLFRGLNTATTSTNPVKVSYNLLDGGAVDTAARMTLSGPIVAEEKYQSVRVTIDKTTRRVEVLTGYKGTVVKAQSYPNSKEAYEAFLNALKAAQFTNVRDTSLNMRSTCVTGNRYMFELSASGSKKIDTWTTSCATKAGSFAGDTSGTIGLFRAQIPNYGEVTNGLVVY